MDLKTYSIYISIYSKLNLNNEKIQANEHVLKNEQMILTLRFYYITNMKNEEINEQALNEINKKRNLNLKKTKKSTVLFPFHNRFFLPLQSYLLSSLRCIGILYLKKRR